MDTPEEAVDYDSMDHSEVNRVFVDDLLAALRTPDSSEKPGFLSVLDVGTGTALIPIELCRRPVECHVTAIDLAQEMLNVGWLGRIELIAIGCELLVVRTCEGEDARIMYLFQQFGQPGSNPVIIRQNEPGA